MSTAPTRRAPAGGRCADGELTDPGPLRLAVLGPLRVWRGETELEVGPVRQRAVLAALALRPNVTVSQRELLDGVWGAEPPGTGTDVVPVYVHRLRRCLRAPGEQSADSVIGRVRGGYRFAGASVAVDAARLEERVAAAGTARDAHDLAAAVHEYEAALELYQGEPLAGLPGPFATGERRRLAERAVAVSREKLTCQLRMGRHAEATGELFALVATHPHSESLAGLLMCALHLGGRRADALSVFAELRRRLVDDLGVEPGEESRQIHRAVLRGEGLPFDLGPVAAPPAPARVAPPAAPARPGPDELPADPGELAGRDRELELLTASADAGTVVVDVVDGLPGAGKTALVVRAAHRLRPAFPDGCLYLNLYGHAEGREPLSPWRALRRLLRAVGARTDPAPDPPDPPAPSVRPDRPDQPGGMDELAARWRAATAGRRLLLVLDDAAGAEQVRPLLPAGPGSRVLVTGRQRLAGLDVRRRISLGPLDPDAAEGLLRGLAGAPGDRERDAVRELARRCGGLPLALRIAAARLQNRPMWTFETLADRLADDEARLGELTAEDRSVEAAFRLSYERLAEGERRAFRALGRWPAAELDRLALAALLACPPDRAERLLEGLLDASLLQQPAAGRYRPHDLVAGYARRLAGTDPQPVDATARAGAFRLYVAAARCASDRGPAAFPDDLGPDPLPFASRRQAAAWLEMAAADPADVVARAASAGCPEHACRLAEALLDQLTRQGRFHDARAAVETALPLADGAVDPRFAARMAASLRVCLGVAYGMQGQFEASESWLVAALEISERSGDGPERARALGALGTVARAQGRTDEATDRLTEARELATGVGDGYTAATAGCDLGAVHLRLGRYDDATVCLEESVALAERLGGPRLLGKALCYLACLHLDLERYEEAATGLRRAGDLAVAAGDRSLHAFSLARLGAAEEGLGHRDAARELYRRALGEVPGQMAIQLERDIRDRLAHCEDASA